MNTKISLLNVLAFGFTAVGLNAAPDFKKDVLPILQERCIDCHAAPYKLYKRITLEEDHDDIMPPKGDSLTPAQQKIIKEWIDAGAKWAPGVVLKRKG